MYHRPYQLWSPVIPPCAHVYQPPHLELEQSAIFLGVPMYIHTKSGITTSFATPFVTYLRGGKTKTKNCVQKKIKTWRFLQRIISVPYRAASRNKKGSILTPREKKKTRKMFCKRRKKKKKCFEELTKKKKKCRLITASQSEAFTAGLVVTAF